MWLVEQLLSRIAATPGRPYVLGITGAPGAGKSTLTSKLAAAVGRAQPELNVSFAPMDGFHLSNEQLRIQGLADRKGAPETFDAAGFAALLDRIRARRTDVVYAPEFDRSIEESIGAFHAVPPGPGLVITEGNYLALDVGAWVDARAALDELWFLDVPPEVRAERCHHRQMRYGRSAVDAQRWIETVDLPNGDLVERTRVSADVVLDMDDVGAITG